jgi:hypothetical protein
MRESQFLDWFPSAGYRWLGIAAPPEDVAPMRKQLDATFARAGVTIHTPSRVDLGRQEVYRGTAGRLAIATSAFVLAFCLLLLAPRRE